MKKWITWVLTLTCMCALTACRNSDLPAEGIVFTLKDAAEVKLLSGLTCDKAEITDAETIASITEAINALSFEKGKNFDGANGCAYSVTWLDAAGNEIDSITITDTEGQRIVHNGYYYRVTDGCAIDTEHLRILVENAQEESVPDVPADTWGVSMSAQNVTSTGMTLVISHSGDAPGGELDTGSPFWLERCTQDGQWETVSALFPDEEIAWTMEAWLIPINDSLEHEVNWEYLYGELPAGQYRIGKEIMLFRGTGEYEEQSFYAEFTI